MAPEKEMRREWDFKPYMEKYMSGFLNESKISAYWSTTNLERYTWEVSQK